MKTDDRDLMNIVSVLRIVFGAAVLLAPGTAFRAFFRVPPHGGLTLLERLFATREVALGVATLDALARDPAPRRLVQVNLAVDALDGTAALLAGRDLPRTTRWFTFLGATGAVVTAARFLRSLDR